MIKSPVKGNENQILIHNHLQSCLESSGKQEELLPTADREWLYLQLTGVTKFKFLSIVSAQSRSTLRAITASVHIIMPDDIEFSSMDVKVCKSRWLMKCCVVISLTLVNLQWFEFTIVSHTIINFYDTTADFVNWTSLIYMLCYVLFTFPVSFLLDNRIVNLRTSMIACNSLILTGACVKVISVAAQEFSVAFLGQVLVALAQVIIINIPSQLAFEWFAVHEKTLICNLSIFGMQLGMLLGFSITPWLVENHEHDSEITADLYRINGLHVGLSLAQLLLVLCVFQAQPKCPPCYLQAIQKRSRCTRQFFWNTFRVLVKSCNFNLLISAYGLQMGAMNTIFTLINPIILYYLPVAEKEAGLMGVTIISASLFSALAMIIILRRIRDLKFMAILTAGMSAASVLVLVMGLLVHSQSLLYISALCLGMFSTAFQTIGYEFAFETTFPESDGTVGGVLNVSAQLFSILITTMVTTVDSYAGYLSGNLLLVGVLLISVGCLTFAQCELKRHNAYQIIDSAAKQLQSDEQSAQQQRRASDEKTHLLA